MWRRNLWWSAWIDRPSWNQFWGNWCQGSYIRVPTVTFQLWYDQTSFLSPQKYYHSLNLQMPKALFVLVSIMFVNFNQLELSTDMYCLNSLWRYPQFWVSWKKYAEASKFLGLFSDIFFFFSQFSQLPIAGMALWNFLPLLEKKSIND